MTWRRDRSALLSKRELRRLNEFWWRSLCKASDSIRTKPRESMTDEEFKDLVRHHTDCSDILHEFNEAIDWLAELRKEGTE